MTVGSIIGGTWRFMRANPGPIAVWAAINLLLAILMVWGMQPFQQWQLASAVARAQGLPPAFPPLGRFLVMWLTAVAMLLVLYNAVFRAVLFPEQRAHAYLRVGGDEARLLGLSLVLGIAGAVIITVVTLLVTIGGALAATRLGASPSAARATILAVTVVWWCAWIFVCVRLVVAAPLTLYRRKIMIGPAWRLTRGHFWTLFGAFLIVTLIVVVISLVGALPYLRPIMAAAAQGPVEARRQIVMMQADTMHFGPPAIVYFGLKAILGGLALAVYGGMPAVAMLQLVEERRPADWPVGDDRFTGPWTMDN